MIEEKKMNKTRKIKELLGTVLSEKGFKYTRLENGIIWTFERTVESVKHIGKLRRMKSLKKYWFSFQNSLKKKVLM